MLNSVVQLASELVSRKSITPDDANCQDIIIQHLKPHGFKIKKINHNGVSNLWAYIGDLSEKTLVFAGHTDVVPPGNESLWDTDPFVPTIKNGNLFGRGTTDMKGTLAAMVIAAKEFIKQNDSFDGAIGFIITSDEEGPAKHGTIKVLEYLKQNNIKIDFCLIGEPSSYQKIADTIHHGRRGSLSGIIDVKGKQGHVGYPENTVNPIHHSLNHIHKITEIKWKEDKHFVPTSLQITKMSTSTDAENVVPSNVMCGFNVRFSKSNSPDYIKNNINEILKSINIENNIEWRLNGYPYITQQDKLINICQDTVEEILGYRPELSTKGGTSDGRFIAKYCNEILELGLNTKTMHAVNEYISIKELKQITKIYYTIIEKVFS